MKLTLPPPMNIPYEVWMPFDDLIQMFFTYFEGRVKRSELEREVTTLISCFVGVNLTHDQLVESYNTKENFEESLYQLLLQLCSSKMIQTEEFKKFVLIYLSKVEDLVRKKKEAKERNIAVVEMISDDNEESANSWLSYRKMHDIFVASFKEVYNAHEVVRGSKLVISSLLQAGMIHETMETIYKEEMELHPFGCKDEMRAKFLEILDRNFPKIPSVPIPVEEIANFLVYYCEKTFLAPAAVAPVDHGEVERKRENRKGKRKRDRKSSEGSNPRNEAGGSKQSDALTTCRQKLSPLIPKDENSDNFKEFNIRFNSLGVVMTSLLPSLW